MQAIWAYRILRFFFLLSTAVALPFALVYLRQEKALQDLSGWVIAFAIGGVFIIAMLHIVLGQFSYPLTLKDSLLTTGGILTSLVASFGMNSSFFYGGYVITFSGLVGSFLFVAWIIGVSLFPAWRARYFEELPYWYNVFLGSLLLVLGTLIYLFLPPVWKSFTPDIWMLVNGSGFVWQVIAFVKMLKEGSIIQDSAYKKSKEQWKTYEAWMGITVILLLLNILSSMVILALE